MAKVRTRWKALLIQTLQRLTEIRQNKLPQILFQGNPHFKPKTSLEETLELAIAWFHLTRTAIRAREETIGGEHLPDLIQMSLHLRLLAQVGKI
jgi:hypothetical protein